MAQVKGFRGYRFDPEVAGSWDDLVTPPYDVIDSEQRALLAAKSPYNMTHVILPQDSGDKDRYEVAAHTFEQWIDSGVLKQDAEESFYLLEQAFRSKDGEERIRRGFFAVVKIPESGESIVLGHERTFSGPVEDRLRLTAATRANLGPVFVLYADPDGALAPFLAQMDARDPDAVAHTIDGATSRIWRVSPDPRVSAFLGDKRLYIADGHHRFKTAGHYRDRMREREQSTDLRPYDYVLMGFVPFDDAGLLICPPHRLVRRPDALSLDDLLGKLSPWFEMDPVAGDLAHAVESGEGCRIGMAAADSRQCLLRLRSGDRARFLGDDHSEAWRALDVAVLHRGILENIMGFSESAQHAYEHDSVKAIEAVANGKADLAFILPPMHPSQVQACAEASDPMPQKSTYFFPKLPTGAVIHRLI